jgi:hypothetical protein
MRIVHGDGGVFVAPQKNDPVLWLAVSPSITSEASGDYPRILIHVQLHDRINIVQWESFHD